jgi:ribosomal protein S18 acetylase RimI-like enzyme
MARDVKVRRVFERDGDDLVEVWDDGRTYYASIDAELFQEPTLEKRADPQRFVASMLESELDPHRFARVAELDRRVVGYIVARVDEPVANADEQLQRDLGRIRGYVEALGVHRSTWRRGVGRALMNEAEQWQGRGGNEDGHQPVESRFGAVLRGPRLRPACGGPAQGAVMRPSGTSVERRRLHPAADVSWPPVLLCAARCRQRPARSHGLLAPEGGAYGPTRGFLSLDLASGDPGVADRPDPQFRRAAAPCGGLVRCSRPSSPRTRAGGSSSRREAVPGEGCRRRG